MALTLPYPGQPASNSALASLPVQANITALAQAIQAFDGSQINAGSVSPSALVSSINPNTILHDTISPFVQSGCVWSSPSGLTGTMTGGTIYAGTSSAIYRVIISGIGSHTFTASTDTYIDIDYNGNVYYSAVANGAASPSLTANSVRVAKVITSATVVTSVVQTGYDSLGNSIYSMAPITPSRWTNPYKFSVYRTSALNSPGSTSVAIAFDAKSFDTSSNVDVVTNKGRFTAPIAGFYYFSAGTAFTTTQGYRILISLYKNTTTEVKRGNDATVSTSTYSYDGVVVTGILQLAAGDYIEAWLYASGAAALNVGPATTFFDGFLVSAT